MVPDSIILLNPILYFLSSSTYPLPTNHCCPNPAGISTNILSPIKITKLKTVPIFC